ncbi:MAG: hypothetical protein HC865_25135 [Cyanobacteria bacterium RU_5_0]|nr:hypothetical protein [Cyanobacteria bacterium RU_5_0]
MPDKPLPIFIGAEAAHPEQKTLITTRTGEPYQPARVYYQVSNQKTVIGAFKKLRCMQFEPSLSSWRWLYDQEAKNYSFRSPITKFPRSIVRSF